MFIFCALSLSLNRIHTSCCLFYKFLILFFVDFFFYFISYFLMQYDMNFLCKGDMFRLVWLRKFRSKYPTDDRELQLPFSCLKQIEKQTKCQWMYFKFVSRNIYSFMGFIWESIIVFYPMRLMIHSQSCLKVRQSSIEFSKIFEDMKRTKICSPIALWVWEYTQYCLKA